MKLTDKTSFDPNNVTIDVNTQPWSGISARNAIFDDHILGFPEKGSKALVGYGETALGLTKSEIKSLKMLLMLGGTNPDYEAIKEKLDKAIKADADAKEIADRRLQAQVDSINQMAQQSMQVPENIMTGDRLPVPSEDTLAGLLKKLLKK